MRLLNYEIRCWRVRLDSVFTNGLDSKGLVLVVKLHGTTIVFSNHGVGLEIGACQSGAQHMKDV